MDYIYRFDTDFGFEESSIDRFYDTLEDEDFYLMYLGKKSFIDFAQNYKLDSAIVDLLLKEKVKKSYVAIEDSYSFIILDLLDMKGKLDKSDLIGFYIEKNRLIVVDLYDRDMSTSRAFKQMIGKKLSSRSPGRALKHFISFLVTSHTKIFDQIKNSTSKIEDAINKNKISNDKLGAISANRHKALNLYTSYERLIDIIEVLVENENEIFDENDIKHLKSLAYRIERYSTNISYLSDYISNVKDSYDSKMDLSMNSTMKFLTIVTTIFTPITVLTGWYGMNFENMPELSWEYGYLYIIGLSLLSLILCYMLFRKLDK